MRRIYIWSAAVLLWLLSAQTAPAQTLREGMSGAAVSELQEALTDAGYLARPADGHYGAATEKAVALFQEDHDLRVTGAADEATVARIEKEDGEKRRGGGVLLTAGNRGSEVLACQHLLAESGYLTDAADGAYGAATERAVRAFQKAKDLPVSGIVDEKTMEALRKGSGAEKGELAQGARGSRVKEAQERLQASGFLSGAADGVYGSQTREAVRRFQREKGLSVSGKIDDRTWKALRETPKGGHELRQGDRGMRVAHLQNLLTLHGFAPGAMDGIYGSGTAEKVRDFQRFCGMEPTGTVNEAVWEKLRSAPVFQGRYKKVMRMQSTAYTPYDGGGSGRTASGNVAGKGHAAVDPNVIPMGSLLFIEGYGYALADDIGGGINGQIVDVGVDDLDQAYRWGNRRVNVYLVQ